MCDNCSSQTRLANGVKRNNGCVSVEIMFGDTICLKCNQHRARDSNINFTEKF
jgi:hypothetical protein